MRRPPRHPRVKGAAATGAKAAAAAALLAGPLVMGAPAAEPRVDYSPAQYLKNFALSQCIAEGYKSEEAAKDSAAAAGGYLELGSFPMQAYEEAAALAKKFLAKEYKGKHGEKLTLMKCIDLFHSKELERLARKYGRR